VPYQGKELRPVGSDFEVLRLTPFCALRPQASRGYGYDFVGGVMGGVGW